MNEHNPDKWVIIKFKSKDNTWYKVLGSWYGGYLHGDSWRLSSGLEKIEQKDDFYLMHNFSGSIYKCHKESDGLHIVSAQVFESIKTEALKQGVEVSLIDVEQFNKEKI